MNGGLLGPFTEDYLDKHTAFALLREAQQHGTVYDVDKATEACVSVSANDAWIREPLHIAAEYGLADVARRLIERGANIEALSAGDVTPLHFAAACGFTDVVRLLLDKGANVDPKNAHQRTPLHRAVEAHHVDVARLLIERGANPNALDEDQRTPRGRVFCRPISSTDEITKRDAMIELLDSEAQKQPAHASGVEERRKKGSNTRTPGPR